MGYSLTLRGKMAFGEPMPIPEYLVRHLSKAYNGFANAIKQIGYEGIIDLLEQGPGDLKNSKSLSELVQGASPEQLAKLLEIAIMPEDDFLDYLENLGKGGK